MKLEKIKLAGFKSFVDPTTIPINGNLTAIVGPNGCGKSNIIDAVRWVMGESSAKHLRGGSMADVIFNGSSGRKPVSVASVELIFNNTESKLGGEYAQYDSIAIKRQVSRDGQSLFMLNGSRCRRKDITDLFLGTGLGSRSYAIIEQGTISRMVEAKPDDLRIHIEEAAGISKYKERRQETETRMQHTRENLERLDDLREEVDKQLKHLQKQAEKAEKYTELKKQERQFKLELLAMRWQAHQQSAAQLDSQLQSVASEHNRLFVLQRELDSGLTSKRSEHKAQQQQLDACQGDYYSLSADVSRLEQAIKHNENSHRETEHDISRTHEQLLQLQSEWATDTDALESLKEQWLETEASLETAEQQLDDAEQQQRQSQQQRQAWQQQWEAYRNENAQYKEQAEVQRVKTVQLENQNRQLQIRMDKLRSEQRELSAVDLQSEIDSLSASIELIEQERAAVQAQLHTVQQQSQDLRQHIKQAQDRLHEQRSQLQAVQGKITSLELLQQHAMGKDNQHLADWLASVGLHNPQRLAEFLDVQPGWETAVETVLAANLEAICLDDASAAIAELARLNDESIMLFETKAARLHEPQPWQRLLDKIAAPWDLSPLLANIFIADNSQAARTLALQLQGQQSIISADGVWFGTNWVKISRTKDSKTGVLQREKELRQLKQRQQELQLSIADCEEQLDSAEANLKTAEATRETLRQQDSRLGGEAGQKNAQYGAQSARLEQQQKRLRQIGDEMADISEELAENVAIMAEVRLLHEEAEAVLDEQSHQRDDLDALNLRLQNQQQQGEQRLNEARQQMFAIKAKLDRLKTSETATQKQLTRIESQQQQAVARLAELQSKLQQTLAPLDGEKQQLVQLRLDKDVLEARLKQHRHWQDDIEADISQLSEDYTRTQRALEKQKEALDQLRYELQESRVRQQTVNEQLKEIDADAAQVLQTLPEPAEESAWKRKVDDLAQQIERLGTINLTAIEEYKAQAERMRFLNEQQADLLEALNTLDQAISKIDKESRLRFKETFDKINSGLQEKFPKLFGGGQAYLELTDQDLLESGVNIIARPPGKRNSSIHLLSGGEKALTAVALVFSIFELNPAPFCLLDEVDAPLDDANVGRFSKMVEEMSASVQFLYISHNKVTMEIAKQLAGVTMKEPGVSRMVAVDIDEAVSLAEI
jgi:chromosome segregation protein